MSLSSVVLCSVFPPLGLGQLFPHASHLPAREEEANEAENLTWKHQEELLPACFAGRREGAVCTSHKGEKLGAPLRLFVRSEEKDSGSRPVLLCACYLAEPHLFIQIAFPGFISFYINRDFLTARSKASKLAPLTEKR